MRSNEDKFFPMNVATGSSIPRPYEDQSPDLLQLIQYRKISQGQITANNSMPVKVVGEKMNKRRQASCRSRCKRKKYQEDLEVNVNNLDVQIGKVQEEIDKCKAQLANALQISKAELNQNSQMFSVLQEQLAIEEPDLDELSLLVDVLQLRTGPNAKERQFNFQYLMKQMISCQFPPVRRYFMHTAFHSKDLYNQKQEYETWTRQFYLKLGLSSQQISKICQYEDSLKLHYRVVLQSIDFLKQIRKKLKDQANNTQYTISEIRLGFNAVQSARLILFSENNKLRKEIRQIDYFEGSPRKKIKKDEKLEL